MPWQSEPEAQVLPQVKVLLQASTVTPHEFVAPQTVAGVTHVLVLRAQTWPLAQIPQDRSFPQPSSMSPQVAFNSVQVWGTQVCPMVP